jgi:transcription elongation GreA/GreB family factor
VREAAGPKLKNYITPAGLQRLKDEHRFLLNRERPAVTEVVAWAAGNGDRSENADYLYGKRRLRQIDSRIRFLTKRIDAAEVVDPAAPRPRSAATRVFFGATVTYKDRAGLNDAASKLQTAGVAASRISTALLPDKGGIAADLFEAARTFDCTTLVVGRHHGSSLQHFLLGSTAVQLVEDAVDLTLWVVA